MTKTEEVMRLAELFGNACAADELNQTSDQSAKPYWALKSAIEELVFAARGPSGIDPTSLGILLSQGDKRFCRVISSSELRQFKKPSQYVVDAATDLVNVFFSGDETMKEITP